MKDNTSESRSNDKMTTNELGTYLETLENKFETIKRDEEKLKSLIKRTSSELKDMKKLFKTCEKIANQMEYYFSDENLKADLFMIGLLRKAKNGYINLGTISKFKKIKN